MLEHLNDRKHAVEKDPRSPGGQGYTGFEAVLQWVFDQSQAINIYDKNGYILKINLFHSKCSDYQNPQSLKEKMDEDPSFYKDCAAILGPNQPSITTPDPTATGRQFASTQKATAKKKTEAKKPEAEPKPKPEESVKDKLPESAKDPVEKVTKKLDKDELRRRAVQRLRRAIEKGGPATSRSCASASRTGSAIKLPKLEDLPKAPDNPQAPTPSFPTPQVPTPSVPNVPGPQGPGIARHRRDRWPPRLPLRAMKRSRSGHRIQPRPRGRRHGPRGHRRRSSCPTTPTRGCRSCPRPS